MIGCVSVVCPLISMQCDPLTFGLFDQWQTKLTQMLSDAVGGRNELDPVGPGKHAHDIMIYITLK